MPGGKDNWESDGADTSENKGKSVSSGGIVATLFNAATGDGELDPNGFKQQRSAGESTGTLQSGKLPVTLQPFLHSELLFPIARPLTVADQSPEQVDSNSEYQTN